MDLVFADFLFTKIINYSECPEKEVKFKQGTTTFLFNVMS